MREKSGTFVASCVVTDSAKRKWIRFVKKELEKISGEQKIYISGCGAFKDGKAQENFFEIYPELADAKQKIEILDEAPEENKAEISLRKSEDTRKNDWEERHTFWNSESISYIRGKIDTSKLEKLKKTQIYTKKYVLIQGGCDSFCTFCLTVVKRGRHFYRSAEDIVEEIGEFEKTWGKEVVLTGVNLSAWGLQNTHNIENFSSDIVKNGVSGGEKSRFAELLNHILENTSIPRIRISSLWPEFITDEVLKLFENERIYPHFHYSIQSGSSKVLKEMARHYDGIYMKKLLSKTLAIKREDEVDISIWADIIVGFPGENDEDFEETYNLVRDYNITKLHAFPFSAHTMGESVPAGSFKNQIDEKVKKERMEKLLSLGEENRKKFYESQRGKTLRVLIEKVSGNTWSGWTQNYLEANEQNFKIQSGEVKKNGIIEGFLKIH